MKGPSYAKYVDESLKKIDSSFHLRWNPRCRMVRPGSFDANGQPTEPWYDGRYEVWGTDANGEEYRIMIVAVQGEYREPGEWLVERLHKLNPARYGGNVSAMLRELVDDPNNVLQEMDERDYRDFINGAVSWYWKVGNPTVSVAKDIK